MLVVAAVVRRPVEAGIFKRTRAEDEGEKFHWKLGLERQMREQAVVADRDAHHRGADEEEEHQELEPVDADLKQVDGNADERDECGADEK